MKGRHSPRNRKRLTRIEKTAAVVQGFCNTVAVMVALIVCVYVGSVLFGASRAASGLGYHTGRYLIKHLPH